MSLFLILFGLTSGLAAGLVTFLLLRNVARLSLARIERLEGALAGIIAEMDGSKTPAGSAPQATASETTKSSEPKTADPPKLSRSDRVVTLIGKMRAQGSIIMPEFEAARIIDAEMADEEKERSRR